MIADLAAGTGAGRLRAEEPEELLHVPERRAAARRLRRRRPASATRSAALTDVPGRRQDLRGAVPRRTPGSCTTTRTCSTRPGRLPGRHLDLGRLRDRGEAADHRAEGRRARTRSATTSTPGSRRCRASRSPRPPAPTWTAATSPTSSRTTSGARPAGRRRAGRLRHRDHQQADLPGAVRQAAGGDDARWAPGTSRRCSASRRRATPTRSTGASRRRRSSTRRTTGTSDTPGHLRRPDRPGHQPGDQQVEDRRGQGVPRVRRRRAGRARRWPASASPRPTPTRSPHDFFALEGVPHRRAVEVRLHASTTTKPENPVSKHTAGPAEHPQRPAHGGPVRQQGRRRARSPRRRRGPRTRSSTSDTTS